MSDSSSISSIASNVRNTIASNSVRTFNTMYSVASKNYSLYAGLLIVILLAIITSYIIYILLGKLLFSKYKTVVDGTKIPVVGNKLSKFNANFVKMSNGNRISYTFWIYLNDMNKNKGKYKNVACVSDNKDILEVVNCSPHIFIDKNNNSLYIRFTIKNDKSFSNIPNDNDGLYRYMKSGISIDYIPLQRWVHVAVVCNSDTFKTTLYAYVDGDLVKSVSNNENFKLAVEPLNINGISASLSNINLNVTDYLYVGNDITDISNGPGFSGLLSSFTAYNYELNQNDVYEIYKNGPITGFLARMGLGLYGVRSPIYKL